MRKLSIAAAMLGTLLGSAGAWAAPQAIPIDYAWAFGLNFGATWQHNFPTNSSSGFYNGDVSSGASSLMGVSLFRDVHKLAPSYPTGGNGGPMVSLGVVLDSFNGVPLRFDGTCGGFPCVGDGRLHQINIIGEIKLTQPIAPLVSINGYVGGGAAFVRPTGSPTGGTAFADQSQTTGAWRVGAGADFAVGSHSYLGAKVGYQWTSGLEFDTTLPGERFKVDTYGNYYAAVTWTQKFPDK
jgi:hypothetical protein